MKIMENNSPSFKTGLTTKLLKDFKNININEKEAEFAAKGIDAKFLNNKFICGSSILTAEILNEVSGKYKLPFDFLPFSIRAYNDKNLALESVKKCRGFCNTNTKKILKDEPPFIGTSLFFNNSFLNFPILFDIDTTINGLLNYLSSPHFLQLFFHEWFHCIQNNLIYKKHGYEGKCPVLRAKYYKPKADGLYITQDRDVIAGSFLNPKFRAKVSKLVSKYAGNSCLYSEFFSELMTKITIKSLDSKLRPVKNPLDNIPRELPASLRKYIERTLNV